MTYLNAKKYICSAPSEAACEGKNLTALLESLGAPHKKIKYLRLAGSNGKTVCAEMLTSVTKKAGYTVGCLKMPLRDEPRENICIGTQCISMDEFAELTSLVRLTERELSLSLCGSELLLAIALLAFKRAACSFCIIESDHFGYDPSVCLQPPFAAVICGTIPSNDTSEISRIRSYICRGISEIVSMPQNSEAYRIISDTCYAVNCRLTLPSRNAATVRKLSLRGTEFTYKGKAYSLNLCGRFQVMNAVLLLEIVEMLSRRGYKISYENVYDGLAKLKLPAKFEAISLSPLIMIDSTHTPVAINTVCDAMTDFKSITGTNIRLCLPCGKIISDYVTALEERGYTIEKIMTVAGSSEEPTPPQAILCTSIKKLAKLALEELDKNTVLLVSGPHSFVIPLRYELLGILGF